jgi:hypothetical protein
LDYDNLDDFYLENVSFEIETSSLSSEIYLGSVNSGNRLNQNSSSWLLNFYSAISVSEEVFIIARDSEGNFVQSNNFTLTFSEPPAVPSTPPSSSGGGTTITKHSSLLISVPSEVQASFGDSISVPISIENNGEVNLVGINLEGLVRLGDSSVGDVDMILSKVFIPSLAVGQKENLVAEVNINTKSAGRYLGIINAISSNPSFSQEGQFYIEIELVQSKNVEEILIFTEKLLVENPECIELRARLDDVAKLKSEGNFVDAMALSEELVESCKNSISQRKGTSLFQGDLSGVLLYLAFGLSGAFLFIIFFYVYKRVKFNKYHEDDYI